MQRLSPTCDLRGIGKADLARERAHAFQRGPTEVRSGVEWSGLHEFGPVVRHLWNAVAGRGECRVLPAKIRKQGE